MEVERRSEENAVFRSSFHLAVNKQRDPEGYFPAVGQMVLNPNPPPPHPPHHSLHPGGRQRQEATLGYSSIRKLMQEDFTSPGDSCSGLFPPSWMQQLCQIHPSASSSFLNLSIPPYRLRAHWFHTACAALAVVY